jgi:outer membrane protein OmpA-like peptidoglycan-associated protein
MRVPFVFLLGLLLAGCGDTSKKPGCKGDKDCKNGLVCAANTCVACTSDTQCAANQRCEANACVARAECERDDQCPSGKVCAAGVCKACTADTECGPGGACAAGVCERPTKCAEDKDCKDDEDCVGGLCLRAGTGSTTLPGVTCQLATVYFGYDDSTVLASERDRLDSNAQCIEKTTGKSVLLLGHTDGSGTEEYNIALSERRGQAVADYLARLGADPARLQVVPKGETESTGLGDDKDRRCDFRWK